MSQVLVEDFLTSRETLRHVTHPIGSMRKAKESLDLQTEEGHHFHIPKGAFVGIPHHLLAHQDKHFSASEVFDPYRFAREEHRSSPFAFVPFSGGRRACPGKVFALMSAKVHLILWLRHFHFELQEPLSPLSWKGGSTLATRRKTTLVKYRKRCE